MYLGEAVDVIREKLVQHRLSGRKTLWSTILKQIAKQDSFDGHYADTILEAIRTFLKPLDDKTIISLWRQTEMGMCDDSDDECLFPDCCRMDLGDGTVAGDHEPRLGQGQGTRLSDAERLFHPSSASTEKEISFSLSLSFHKNDHLVMGERIVIFFFEHLL